MTPPLIRFDLRMEPFGSSGLATGLLSCTDSSGAGIILPATSGARGFQSEADVWTVGKGPLPPLPGYTVTLNPEPKVAPGIDGDFFRILPVVVTNSAGVKRSGFGIHRDANSDSAPGSAGCIVIRGFAMFARFELWALEQLERGHKYANLELSFHA